MNKKRSRDGAIKDKQESSDIDTSKPTAIFTPTGGRSWTSSIALPGSIVANAQTRERQAALVGQIARALALFCVDEVVIFDDGQHRPPPPPSGAVSRHSVLDRQPGQDHDRQGYTGFTDPNFFLAHLLSYLECPPYLRRSLFPMHPDLQHSGTMPSLDMPHHLKKHETCQFREGITVGNGSNPAAQVHHRHRDDGGHQNGPVRVHTGLEQDSYIDANIPVNTRVTLEFTKSEDIGSRNRNSNDIDAIAVAPDKPRQSLGYYWGYAVRTAASLSAVLTECPYDGGYDLAIGTSERGIPVSKFSEPSAEKPLPRFNHMMVVFGGVAGLEPAVAADSELRKLGVKTPDALFDYWVNLLPGQGSRTMRTEEAVWIGLASLRQLAISHGR